MVCQGQKDSWSLESKLWMPRTLQNNVWLLKFVDGRKAFDPVCNGLASWNFDVLTNFIFVRQNEIWYGVKSIMPFSKLTIGKSQAFSARSYVYFHGYTQIRDRGGTMCLPLVLIGLMTHKSILWPRLCKDCIFLEDIWCHKIIMDVLTEFLESTTIHGLAYISSAKVGLGKI